MRRLRFQFLLFFILLAGSLGFFVWNSYRQLGREEREIWKGQAEKVYNQMQASVSDFLTAEDTRRWSDYRFYGTLRPGMYPKQPVGFSPISKPPRDDSRGLIGYFQIDPEGEFSTPYLPERWPAELDALVRQSTGRRELYRALEDVTSSLRPVRGQKGDTAVPAAATGFVELGRLQKTTPEILEGLQDLERLAGEQVTASRAEEAGEAKPVQDADDKEGYQGAYKDAKQDRPMTADGEFARGKNVYPNPIQEQAVQLEKRKMGATSKAAAAPIPRPAKREMESEEMPPPAPPVVAAAGASRPEAPASSVVASATESFLPASILADPFQARLVGDKYLLFYRKVWADHRQYLQGFAVELEKFYSWLMDQSFANSDLPEFALARLELQGRALAQYGIVDLALDSRPAFFERSLGYPLNLFEWRVYAASLPRLGSRWFLNGLSGAVALLATIGLYLIYRTAASQVVYSQKRQDFVSAVTHELKTPLTSIRMYSEMLEDGWAKEESKRKEYYQQINKESSRLSRLIENVLQLARLEKKTYKLNLKKEVPTHDFEEICGELKKIAERQGFTVSWKAADDLSPLLYDPEAVKQILLSLLDNSLKFGAEAADKSLEASLEREAQGVAWSWKDRGPGIPEKELGRIFENFYRVENEMTRKTQGTGIGLAMSRMLAEAMGGRIEARNRPGGGLEVRVSFPAT